MFNFRDLSPDWYLVIQMVVLYKAPFMDLSIDAHMLARLRAQMALVSLAGNLNAGKSF